MRFAGFGLLRGIVFVATLVVLAGCGAFQTMSASSDDGTTIVRTLELRDEALADYLGPYQSDGLHKAFAVSGDGTKFGVGFNFETQDEAQRAALAKCTEALEVGDIECVVYDVDGEIILFLPVTLRIFQG